MTDMWSGREWMHRNHVLKQRRLLIPVIGGGQYEVTGEVGDVVQFRILESDLGTIQIGQVVDGRLEWEDLPKGP